MLLLHHSQTHHRIRTQAHTHTHVRHATPHHTRHTIPPGLLLTGYCIDWVRLGTEIGDSAPPLTSLSIYPRGRRLRLSTKKKRSKQPQLGPQTSAQFLITPPLFDPQGQERGNLRQQGWTIIFLGSRTLEPGNRPSSTDIIKARCSCFQQPRKEPWVWPPGPQ